MNLEETLKRISTDVEFYQPASRETIGDAEAEVGLLPAALRRLLERTNGVACRSFRLYSAFDRMRPKKTWESLQRANSSDTVIALGGNAGLLKRFLVIADIGGGFAAIERSTGTIWFMEAGSEELRQTDLSFEEFLETMVRNAT